jgi:hypothetical protein
MRRIGIAVLGVIASLALAACEGGTYPTGVTTYRAGPGENQVTVRVDADEPDQVAHVTVMRGTSDVVQVRAELDSVEPADPDVPRIGVGYTVEVVINLAEPLGGRTLLAENGSPVLREPTFTS